MRVFCDTVRVCLRVCVQEGGKSREPSPAHVGAMQDDAGRAHFSVLVEGRAGRCGPLLPGRNRSGSSAGVRGPTAELVVPTTLLPEYEE